MKFEEYMNESLNFKQVKLVDPFKFRGFQYMNAKGVRETTIQNSDVMKYFNFARDWKYNKLEDKDPETFYNNFIIVDIDGYGKGKHRIVIGPDVDEKILNKI